MELVTCVMCGKLFNTFDKKVCSQCAKKEDEYFQVVKKELKSHPGLRLDDICKRTGVPANLIRRWLRDGRLKLANTDGADLRCDGCGKVILQGKLCTSCREDMQKSISDLYKSEGKAIHDKDGKQKMRFLDN